MRAFCSKKHVKMKILEDKVCSLQESTTNMIVQFDRVSKKLTQSLEDSSNLRVSVEKKGCEVKWLLEDDFPSCFKIVLRSKEFREVNSLSAKGLY